MDIGYGYDDYYYYWSLLCTKFMGFYFIISAIFSTDLNMIGFIRIDMYCSRLVNSHFACSPFHWNDYI